MIIDEVCEDIVNGEKVKLQYFEKFKVREKKESIGSKKKKGEEVKIIKRSVMKLKEYNVIKKRILKENKKSKGKKQK